ncbi:potassium channel family protein [Maridesulfovibrio bastinii]|uniref:potassium channel family protein n=1 Tax=Maridesulfovibrio bastinii TaxID=47157 RepID=UPI0003F61892|nr:potassium channel family protein [Maridesulfovibrio bastinii]
MFTFLGRFSPFAVFRKVNTKFTFLLVFLALQGIVSSMAGNAVIFQKILYFYTYLVFLAAVSAIIENKVRLYFFAGLFALSLACSMLFFSSGQIILLAVSECSDSIMLLMTSLGILGYMLRQKRVTGDLVSGSICIYLLMGLLWTNIYALCVMADHGAVSGLSEVSNIFIIKKDLNYFSFMTMLTVGYGDIVPVSDLVKAFAVLQGIFGQMYIAVFVASVIGMFLSQEVRNSD